ncbi:MAG: zonular occludens toxin domain-containing protein [Aquabacterium sp.]
MAINCYCGLQGSGKSYEVVSSVVIEAVAAGRRVVTNIAGIDEGKIHEYLVTKRNAEEDKLGLIVHIENERIKQPNFFPDEAKPSEEAVVRGGDLVAIDEAWRFWGTDEGKLSHEHMQFFRMHRHYVHPDTAVACDVALMTQDVTGLHRSVKNVIEVTFRMQKHKKLGFANRYRVDIHDGWKLNRGTHIDSRQKSYDPEMFPLYQSYAGGKGRETAIDKRQNLFANRALWGYMAFILVLSGASCFMLWRFFHPALAASSQTAKPVLSSMATATQASHQVVSDALPPFSDSWRIAGEYQNGNEHWVVLASADGRVRVESPSMFTGAGVWRIGSVDGARVGQWTGQMQRSQAIQPSGSPR